MGKLKVVLLAILASATTFQICSGQELFSGKAYINWIAGGPEKTSEDSVTLRMNKTGGSGFQSNSSYLFGSVTMQIKLVQGNSAGSVTTFYLSSQGGAHDEIDFEFLGNTTGEPYTIHTNIFTQGVGQREMQFKAWFDTAQYHNYTIQWTPFAVVWLVDAVPIRVFRNFHDAPNINFTDSQPMKAYASLWNGDAWATQGGRIKTDFSLAPFDAYFSNYNPNACICPQQNTVEQCSSNIAANWWTDASKYDHLTESQYYQMKWIQQNNKIYDYCESAIKKGLTPSPECSRTQN